MPTFDAENKRVLFIFLFNVFFLVAALSLSHRRNQYPALLF